MNFRMKNTKTHKFFLLKKFVYFSDRKTRGFLVLQMATSLSAESWRAGWKSAHHRLFSDSVVDLRSLE